MADPTYEGLNHENTELSRALFKTKELFEKARAEKDQLFTLHEEFKQQYERVRGECEESHRKLVEVVTQKKELEAEYEAQISHLKKAFELRQRELDEM